MSSSLTHHKKAPKPKSCPTLLFILWSLVTILVHSLLTRSYWVSVGYIVLWKCLVGTQAILSTCIMYVCIYPVIYLFIIVPCLKKETYGNFKSMWSIARKYTLEVTDRENTHTHTHSKNIKCTPKWDSWSPMYSLGPSIYIIYVSRQVIDLKVCLQIIDRPESKQINCTVMFIFKNWKKVI